MLSVGAVLPAVIVKVSFISVKSLGAEAVAPLPSDSVVIEKVIFFPL